MESRASLQLAPALTPAWQRMTAVIHQVSPEGKDLATGVYLGRMVMGPFSQTIRIALVRKDQP
ncbi:MAG TPA: hypothetical protein PLG50_13295 [bacterium]|nr:hypothetical protein [bacterium]HQG46629.1 hypothetical protein [bacterium]HQI49698.1 hypothetical protein [bacterium]HQJ66402.1 hypothetical protein [bacterium]